MPRPREAKEAKEEAKTEDHQKYRMKKIGATFAIPQTISHETALWPKARARVIREKARERMARMEKEKETMEKRLSIIPHETNGSMYIRDRRCHNG